MAKPIFQGKYSRSKLIEYLERRLFMAERCGDRPDEVVFLANALKDLKGEMHNG